MATHEPFNLGTYSEPQPFKYWCQKVLPLVYDDSLSYYELLAKVVDYINKLVADDNTLIAQITELQNWFDNLDVSEEINAKLDTMAENGELYALIEPYLDDLSEYIRTNAAQQQVYNENTRQILFEENARQIVYNRETRTMLQNMVGHPYTASTAEAMTDTDKVYVYTGTTTASLTNGHWYFYDGSAWTDGGVYNSAALETDKTLLVDGAAADARYTGIRVNGITAPFSWSVDAEKYNLLTGASETIEDPALHTYANTGKFKCTSFSGIAGFDRTYTDGCAVVLMWDDTTYIGVATRTAWFDTGNVSHTLDTVPYFNTCLVQVYADVWENDYSDSYTDAIRRNSHETDTELKTQGIAADAGAVGAEFTHVKQDISELSIEGYEKSTPVVTGTVVNNAFYVYSQNAPMAVSGWSYLTVSCEPNTTYLISGTASTAGRLFCVLDANNTIIYGYPEEQSVRHDDYEYTTPSNGVKIIVNAQNSQGIPLVKQKTMNFVPSGQIGTQLSEDVYRIGNGKFTNEVSLHGSENGTFRFDFLKYDGSNFKNCIDDITPVNFISAEYVGANHGFIYVYSLTISDHGLTTADIGKTCIIDGDTWVLIKIKNSNTVEVICRGSQWWGLKRVPEVPTTFNFGTVLTVSSSSLVQLLPSVRNVSVQVTKNTAELFEVLETYDIIDPSVGIAWLVDHVGSCTNDTLAEKSDGALTVKNLYQFDRFGSCAIVQNLRFLKTIGLNFYGGTQSSQFGENDRFVVPETSYKSLDTASETVNFLRSTWDSSTKPPTIYIQANHSGGNADKHFVTGILSDARNSNLSDSAGFYYTSRKMYPYGIQPNTTVEANTVFSLVSFRIPAKYRQYTSNVHYAGYCKIGKDYYVYVATFSAQTESIILPEEMRGKKVTTIVSTFITAKNDIVVDSLDVVATRQGYLFVKLSD